MVLIASLFLALGAPPAFSAGGMGSPTAAGMAGPDLDPSDPLATVNAAFRRAYADLRSETLSGMSPVIYAAGDDLVLVRDGQRSRTHADTRLYHELKAIAHQPLAVYLMLRPGLGSPLAPARIAPLRSYRELLVKARESLEGRALSPAQRERGDRILERSMKFLDSVLAAGQVSEAELKAFARGQRADIEANERDAAVDEISTVDAQVEAWLAPMAPEERARLRVIVGGSHMPRVGNILYQYFQAKFGSVYEGRAASEKGGDGRLVYGEAMWDEKKAFDLLATHRVDAGIGDAFFEDDQRMHRDLLGDAAEEAIAEKLGSKPQEKQVNP